MSIDTRRRLAVMTSLCGLLLGGSSALAADLTAQEVLKSIEQATRYLASVQQADGSWVSGRNLDYKIGVSSLALLALLNAGMTPDDPPVRNGLKYFRSLSDREMTKTYEISLAIMVLAAAKDGRRDKARIFAWAQKLEKGQQVAGDAAGAWSYSVTAGLVRFGYDHSNSQYAVLGLRDAAEAGYPVDRQTWQRIDQHWRTHQNGDGGWGYSGSSNSTGSMTVAGIATLTITSSMLHEADDLNPDGSPNCCAQQPEDRELELGIRWLTRNFSSRRNPGNGGWYLYYLYGLERAGRLSGRRFFGDHDWYREGAEFLIRQGQNKRTGAWRGVGGLEGSSPSVGTSFALLFLSKGMAPVLINKLKFPSDAGDARDIRSDSWNQHHNDVRNLTNLISGLPKWPKLLAWQVVDLNKAVRHGSVADLMQSPVLYLAGNEAPKLSEQQVLLLRQYVDQGGFIFAVACCDGTFDDGFHELVRKIYPVGEAQLKPLTADHPIYRAQYLLDADAVRLEGVDFGCRTSIVYSSDDISCLWDMWARQDPPKRTPQTKSMITRATRIGINVIAYATGRELWDKIGREEFSRPDGQQDKVERGFLQIAKLRHTGRWDAAPQALRNLLSALNRTVGLSASTNQRNLPASDPNVFKYPMLYMHGRNSFGLSKLERDQLKKYFSRGGVLFADACCAARQFDRSFRDLMADLYPDKELKRIPIDHELFTTAVGHDIRRVRRRIPGSDDPKTTLNTAIHTVEPYLEGIEIDGRYVVIYSKYDISCALERQASVACSGYLPEDAEKIGINIILYALLQDVSKADALK